MSLLPFLIEAAGTYLSERPWLITDTVEILWLSPGTWWVYVPDLLTGEQQRLLATVATL